GQPGQAFLLQNCSTEEAQHLLGLPYKPIESEITLEDLEATGYQYGMEEAPLHPAIECNHADGTPLPIPMDHEVYFEQDPGRYFLRAPQQEGDPQPTYYLFNSTCERLKDALNIRTRPTQEGTPEWPFTAYKLSCGPNKE